MATSGVTTFNVTRNQIVEGALRVLGVVPQGETPTAVQYTEASEALNMMIKAWEADGMPLWGLTEYALTPVAGTNKYQIGIGKTINIPKPLKVIQMWNRDNNSLVDIPMRILTKQEYNILGNKSSSGNPIQGYYNPQGAYGELYLFPTPDATTAANNKIYIVYQRPFEDFVNATDNPDFPQEWLEALKYGLALRLSTEYGVSAETRAMVKQDAADSKTSALSYGTEEGSVYFQREFRQW